MKSLFQPVTCLPQKLLCAFLVFGQAGGNQPAQASALPEVTPLEIPGGKLEVQLPDAFTNLVIGGAGRFVILHFPELYKMGVFDVSRGEIVKYLPADGDEVLMAAGANDLLVLLKEKEILQRWGLDTFELEKSIGVEGVKNAQWMAMGAASAGPLAIGIAGDGTQIRGPEAPRMKYLDPETMGNFEVEVEEKIGRRLVAVNARVHVRASAAGNIFGGWRSGSNPSGLYATQIEDGRENSRYEHKGVGYAVPNSSGSHLFTARGIFNFRLQHFGEYSTDNPARYPIPAVSGNFYISVPAKWDMAPKEVVPQPMAIHFLGDARPLAYLPQIPAEAGGEGLYCKGNELTLEKRFILIPEAKALVTHPRDRCSLTLFQVDLDEELRGSEVDYLFVSSSPDRNADPGDTWQYSPVVRSKQGSYDVSLEAGPEGMELVDGVLKWDVPESSSGRVVPVAISVRGDSGSEVFQSWTVTVAGEVDLAGAKPVHQVKMKRLPPPEILPPAMDAEQVEIDLPDKVTSIKVGGAGRYLVMHFKSLREIGIFDVNKGALVKRIPVKDDSVQFAAGLNKLFVIMGNGGLVLRWDLNSMAREYVAQLPVDGSVEIAEMGSASDEVLVLGMKRQIAFRYLHYLRADSLVEVEMIHNRQAYLTHNHLEVSANGRVFVGSTRGNRMMDLHDRYGNSVNVETVRQAWGLHGIGAEGSPVYSNTGIWPVVGELIESGASVPDWHVVAQKGSCFLAVKRSGEDKAKVASVNLCCYQQGKVEVLGEVPALVSRFDQYVNGLTYLNEESEINFRDRFHFVPEGNLVVELEGSDKALILHRVDVGKAIEQSPADILMVRTPAPQFVYQGEELVYEIGVISNSGEVRFELESGPEGMNVDAEGKLSWKVPEDYPSKPEDVVVKISGKDGSEIAHRFTLDVGGFVPGN